MKNKFAIKRSYGASQFQKRKWRWLLMIGVLIILFSLTGFLAYRYKKTPLSRPILTSHLANAVSWIKGKSQISSHEMSVRPRILVNNSNEEHIHFEFYNTLTNMEAQPLDNEDELMQMEDNVPILKKPISKIPNQRIVKAEDLENELAHQIKQKKYTIQLGIFRDLTDAKRYRMILAKSGINGKIITIKIGKKIHYRVQEGSYSDVEQARSAQIKLQKEGIITTHILIEG